VHSEAGGEVNIPAASESLTTFARTPPAGVGTPCQGGALLCCAPADSITCVGEGVGGWGMLLFRPARSLKTEWDRLAWQSHSSLILGC